MTTLPLVQILPATSPHDVARACVAGPAADRSRADRLAARLVRLTFVVCLAAHVWLISAGWWAYWPQYTARYDLLARAFAAGQTSLLIKADPRHLALPDPYDPVANNHYRQVPGVPDSCLYDGKFYLYWGPVPALLLTPARWFLDTDTRPGDQFLTFAFVQGTMLATAGLLLRLRARHFAHAPAWLPAVALAVAALTAPITCVLTRGAVYEAAIVGGQCFLLAGIYLAWRSFDRLPASQGESRQTPVASLALSGLSLACAVGCRVSLAVAVAAVGLLVVGRIVLACRGQLGRALVPLLAFGLPAMAGAVGLGAYNHARFGSWLEFGQRYQLAGVNLKSYPSLFGVANVWPGLWSYFARPVAVVDRVPYLLMAPGDGTFPSFVRLPEHYESYERIGGLLWTVPVLWLLPVGVAALLLRRRSARRRSDNRDAVPSNGADIGHDRLAGADRRWLLAALSAAAVLGFLPVLLMIGSSQRYLADLTPPLVPVLMAMACALTDPRRTGPRAARRWFAALVALAGVSAAAGLLLAFEGYAGHFRVQHPELFESLSGPLPDAASSANTTSPAPTVRDEAKAGADVPTPANATTS